jgi:RNA methyltransferase, TrmH family
MITSADNEKVRHVRALHSRRRARERERQMVAEGVRLVEEALRAGLQPAFVFHTGAALADARSAQALATLQGAGVPCFAVSDAVMAASSDTETPQGLLAVLPLPDLPLPLQPTLTLIVDGVRDPGNLGTMLRTAPAAGVEQVLLAPGTVDPFNSKVVRAGMGAHFGLPIAALPWPDVGRAVAGCDVWLAAAGGALAHSAVDWTRRAALIVGGEAAGAGGEARALASGAVAIPMAAGVESLNAATAAAVILFEAVRQRMAARGTDGNSR